MTINNPDEIIQIGLIDTGKTTALGEKIFAVDVSGSTLSIIATAALKPDGYSEETITPAGTPTTLSVTTKGLSAIIQLDDGSTADGTVFNIGLTPGETIIIESVPDVSWIIVDGAVGTTFNVTILENSTL